MQDSIARVLVCDESLCQSCGNCDDIAKFKMVHKGCVLITYNNAEREEIKQAVRSLVTGCPHGAISYS